MPDLFKQWEQNEEWLQQKAEGERRKWAYEDRRSVRTQLQGGKVLVMNQGKGHSMDEVPPDIYTEGKDDVQALKSELRDLERDATLMEKHLKVNYFPDDPAPEKTEEGYAIGGTDSGRDTPSRDDHLPGVPGRSPGSENGGNDEA